MTTGISAVRAIGLQLAADLEAVHARHHHVEQYDVGQLGIGEFEGAATIIGA